MDINLLKWAEMAGLQSPTLTFFYPFRAAASNKTVLLGGEVETGSSDRAETIYLRHNIFGQMQSPSIPEVNLPNPSLDMLNHPSYPPNGTIILESAENSHQ
jgi:hypothetical protein